MSWTGNWNWGGFVPLWPSLTLLQRLKEERSVRKLPFPLKLQQYSQGTRFPVSPCDIPGCHFESKPVLRTAALLLISVPGCSHLL